MAIREGLIRTVIAVLCLLVSGEAFAHRPYLRELTSWIAPDGRQFTLAMLYGDGIFFADPARPVVLDQDGQVIALGPPANDGTIKCDVPGDCRFLLGLSEGADAVVPDPAGFRDPIAGRDAAENGLPYPEYVHEEYGFRPAPMSASDQLYRWTTAYRRDTIVAIIITGLFGLLGYWTGAWAAGWARILKPRITRTALRWPLLAVSVPMVTSVPLLLSFFVLAWHVAYGGTELTILPCFVGFALGGLLAIVRSRSRSRRLVQAA